VQKLRAETERIKAEKVVAGVTAAYSAMQTAEVIAGAPQVAPITDKVLEAAGYTVPTPPGVDPNLPVPVEASVGSGVTPAAVEAAQAGPIDLPESGNTSPMFPAPPESGHVGLETEEDDG